MVARHWTARATVVGAEAYLRFFADTLVPELGKIEGHRGAQVLVRPVADQVEITHLAVGVSVRRAPRCHWRAGACGLPVPIREPPPEQGFCRWICRDRRR